MRLIVFAVAAFIGNVATTLLESDALAAKALSNLKLYVAQKGYPNPETCTWKNVVRRREWSRLRRSEKLNYIKAVQCLGKSPARTPATIAAGAKSRYDDFVVTHVLLTMVTHGNVCLSEGRGPV
jgi:tyrosinase